MKKPVNYSDHRDRIHFRFQNMDDQVIRGEPLGLYAETQLHLGRDVYRLGRPLEDPAAGGDEFLGVI